MSSFHLDISVTSIIVSWFFARFLLSTGGLESKGHPIGATGLGQIYELVKQLRGHAGPRQVENAKIAIAENGRGLQGIEEVVACVTILSR